MRRVLLAVFVVLLWSCIGLEKAEPKFSSLERLFDVMNDDKLISFMNSWEFAQVVKFQPDAQEQTIELQSLPSTSSSSSSYYRPVVQMHGMGDFADNPLGMLPMKRQISQRLGGAYVVNAKLGDNIRKDILGSFFKVMDEEVDYFAEFVRNDENLANGFNAIGYSQGNLVIRGYIEKYNDPPVYNWVSVHGPLAGVAGFPSCDTEEYDFCALLDRALGFVVYANVFQNHLAQANYYRDPFRAEAYRENCHFLPMINNEAANVAKNATYASNISKLEGLALVKALADTVVKPNDSEWFGFYADGGKTLLPYSRTKGYLDDSFGLQTLDTRGRLYFHTTSGDHLQFDSAFLDQMVDTYFTN